MTEMRKANCKDCGADVSQGALIVSTVIGEAVAEALCCPTSQNIACALGFLDRASDVLGVPAELYDGDFAEVFKDDDHFVKISPTYGPVLV